MSLSHLQIFNPSHSQYAGSEFHFFPHLPTELRLKIWRHVLEKERLIAIQLISKTPESDLNLRFSKTHYDYPSTDESFWAFAGGYQTVSKLFRTNRESRGVALSFFRVQIPCRLTTIPENSSGLDLYGVPAKAGFLYFNPEYDFLQISILHEPEDCLVDFLHHLKVVYDPVGVGLLNIAADTSDLRTFQDTLLASQERTTFLESIQQLQEVFLLHKLTGGRTNFGYSSGMTANKVFFNRSLPIMPLTPSFERLSQDPRLITEDLTRIYLSGSSPSDASEIWETALMRWGLSSAHDTRTKVRHLVALSQRTGDHAVYDRETAMKFLRREDYIWREEPMRKLYFTEAEDLDGAVKPAFGFWLFDKNAFKSSKEDLGQQPEHFGVVDKRIRDLSSHWPTLALSNLS